MKHRNIWFTILFFILSATSFAQKSDIVVYPEAHEFAWDDFHKGKVLMQRGENACQKVLEEIKALVKPPL